MQISPDSTGKQVDIAGPDRFARMSLSEEDHCFALNKAPSLQPVEIGAAGKVCAVEANLMVSGLLSAIEKTGNSLAESIEDRQCNVGAGGQRVTDHRRGVKGVGIILRDTELPGDFHALADARDDAGE